MPDHMLTITAALVVSSASSSTISVASITSVAAILLDVNVGHVRYGCSFRPVAQCFRRKVSILVFLATGVSTRVVVVVVGRVCVWAMVRPPVWRNMVAVLT